MGENIETTLISHRSVLNSVHEKYPNEYVRMSVHLPTGLAGGLSLLENAILVSLLKLIDPKEIFEFGTYLGASTVLLAVNSDSSVKITTLDLEPETIAEMEKDSLDQTEKSQNDDYLRAVYKEQGASFIARESAAVRNRITHIECDSRELDLEKHGLRRRFPLIFIDGGHDMDIIKNDSELALEMAEEDAVIVWHDYTSTIHTDVTDYIDNHCPLRPVYHIQHTLLAAHPTGKNEAMFEKIKSELEFAD